ncbi:MAG TPA: hypothetical protein VFW47_00410 [Phenylobacterium sp.]|nr:hypothetical protein [Phenylobacterium sp.]
MAPKTDKEGREVSIESRLKGMFRALARRPVPDSIRSVVDQLDVDAPPSKAKQRKG